MLVNLIVLPDHQSAGLTPLGKNQVREIGRAFENDTYPPERIVFPYSDDISRIVAGEILPWMQQSNPKMKNTLLSPLRNIDNISISGFPTHNLDPRILTSLRFPEALPTSWNESGAQYIARVRIGVEILLLQYQSVAIIAHQTFAKILRSILLSSGDQMEKLDFHFSPGSISRFSISQSKGTIDTGKPQIWDSKAHFGE